MANQFEIEGSIKLIFDTQSFASGFQKREFVVTTQDKYPQDIKFEVVKDKCSLLDDLQAETQVKVSFDIRGNEYKDRYYVNLNAWKIEAIDSPSGADDRPVHLEDEAAANHTEFDEEPF